MLIKLIRYDDAFCQMLPELNKILYIMLVILNDHILPFADWRHT